MKLYSIRDSAAGFFLPILEAHNDQHAQRIVLDALTADHPMVRHRNDYHLYCVAGWDNTSGEIQPIRPEPVIALGELIEAALPSSVVSHADQQTDIEDAINGAPTETEETPF